MGLGSDDHSVEVDVGGFNGAVLAGKYDCRCFGADCDFVFDGPGGEDSGCLLVFVRLE